MRFRILKDPKVRLNIAGIVIANVSAIHSKYLGVLNRIIELLHNLLEDSDVFSFFIGSNVIADKIHPKLALHSLARYMFHVKSIFPFNSYDRGAVHWRIDSM